MIQKEKDRTSNRHITPTRLHMALLMALGQSAWIPGIPAQIVVDTQAPSSQQPTVLEASNGVPLVNIQTPSAAGVSRNTYQQFDVNTSGAILNNASTNTQTQLGGWIQGNPHLTHATARVILNEINASDPSQLQGWIEIAGQRAELVIANPAGITCNGCGFINTERATLSTGTPIMHGSNLEGYRVHGGSIAITGSGMDTRSSDYTALIARSVAINADLWAQQLQIITGSQEVSAHDYSTMSAITPDKNTPTFALDVSALGGMYAQKIVLRGTEYGVGVRNAGTIGAQAGELTVTVDGRLENRGRLHAHTDMQLAANEINNSGIISANQALNAQANQTIDNRNGQLFSADTLNMQAENFNNSNGLLYINRNTQDALHPQLGIQGKQINLNAQQIDNIRGTMAADQTININNTQQLDNNEGTISAAQEIAISAQAIKNDHGTLLAEKLLAVNANSLIGNGQLLSKGDIDITLQHDFIHTGEITANGSAHLHIANRLENHGLVQAGDLSIHSQSIHNTENGIFQGNRNSIIADNRLENRGIIDGQITYIKSNTLDNIGSGRIYGNQLSIATDTLYNHEENSQSAVIAARECLDIGVKNLFNREHALIFSAGTGRNALNIGGSLDAHQQATGQATLIRNDSATIESLGDLSIDSQSLLNTNLHFATELVQVAGPQRYLYIQPKGQPNKQNSNEFLWEKWSKSGRYRHKLTGQEIRDWTQFDVVQTEYQTQVITSDPALIRVGGDINLRGEKLTNDKSQIIAGGVLQGDLDHLDNIDGLGEYIINQVGTSQYTESDWRGGFKNYHERNWDAKIAYTPADEVKTISLDVVKTEHNTQSNGSGFTVTRQQAIKQIENIRTIETNIDIPDNHLFKTNPNAHYWIETDPRFTDYQQWLSSDYMLDQLGMDPKATHKRLGDGFYEQQLVRDQIGQLTGRRFLEGYANDENQYRGLLEAGATFAKTWQLRPGVALSAEQMARLTSDIVWLVERPITLPDGTSTTALVPQVYVRLQPEDLNGRGTLLSADRVDLNLNADLVNSGTIAGTQ